MDSSVGSSYGRYGSSLCATGYSGLSGMVGLLSFTAILRCFWSIGNWIYQCMYFSLRMWLVFVLHAFCVSAFTVMYELFRFRCMYLSVCLSVTTVF